MNFKPGDKVRFLNTTGGGTVTKNINSFMVSVAIEDGFEIPTLTSELVIIEPSGTSDKMFTRAHEQVAPPKPVEPIADEYDRTSRIRTKPGQHPVPSGIYLAYVPHDQQWMMTGNLDIFLINHTDMDILYSFFLKDAEGKFSGIDYGSIEKSSKLALESIVREDIEQWSGGVVQILFHSDEGEKVLMPVSTTFRIKGTIFYKDGSYKECGLLDNQKAIMYTVCELNRIPSTVEHLLNEKEGLDSVPVSARQFVPESAIDRYRIAPREAEVDLHISALRDKYENLSPNEILTIQIGVFERMLENAMARNYTRVVFIHGVGNGTLKQALIDRLKDYGDIEFRNAPFAKYGNGAVEIVIHQNM
ncbi:MAG: DUF2027 domain-containing protein [Bacteroidetes bacterium]|nr:DUF2027 domain-containing protein [Bacteroidota bacterium]